MAHGPARRQNAARCYLTRQKPGAPAALQTEVEAAALRAQAAPALQAAGQRFEAQRLSWLAARPGGKTPPDVT